MHLARLLRRGRCGRRRRARRLEFSLDAELDELTRRLGQRFGRRADDLDRPLEVAGRFQVRDEIGEPRQRRAPAVDDDGGLGLLQLRQPQHRRQRAADLIEHVHGSGLSAAQLLDEDDALLQLRLALLELLYLLDDRVQPRRFLLRRGDIGVDLRRLVRERPVAPADEQARQHENETAADRDLLTDGAERDRLLLGAFALRREKVDADHRSPAFLSARPTATAAVAPTASTSATPSFAGSNATFRNGSNDSTAEPNRSCSAAVKPSTRDAPPLTTMRSIRS